MSKKYNVIRCLLSISLAFICLWCICISAYAYRPVVSVNSSDWVYNNAVDPSYIDNISSAVYPKLPSGASGYIDECYQYSDLNGQTYFTSKYWMDDLFKEDEFKSVKFPALGVDEDGYFGESYKNACKIIYENNDVLYMDICMNLDGMYANGKTMVEPYYDSNDIVYFGGLDGSICYVETYRLAYPYTTWSYVGGIDRYGESGDIPLGYVISQSGIVKIGNLAWWGYDIADSDGVVYDMYLSDSSDPDGYVGFTFHWVSSTYYAAIFTALNFQVTGSALRFLKEGSACIRLDDFGFIAGTGDGFSYEKMYMVIQDSDGNVVEQVDLVNDCITGISAGQAYVKDYVLFCDFFYDEELVDNAEYTVTLYSALIADNYTLFFPGTFEIIEFESYEDDMEHKEVLNAVEEAKQVISGSITETKNELSKEIVNSSNEIKSAVNESAVTVSSSVESAKIEIVESVKQSADKIANSVDSLGDKLSDKLEDTKNSILNGIKDFFIPSDDVFDDLRERWSNLLKKRFGALYEVTELIFEYTDKIKYAGEKKTIDFPEVTVYFGDTPFVFGGYEVKIVPDGIEILVTTLKLIVSVVCTLLFLNALKMRYERLMGGNNE